MADDEKWWAPLRRAFRAGIAFIGHLAVSLVLVGCIRALELAIRWLWGGEEPLLFERVPLQYLFHALDLAVILILIYWGTVEAFRKLKV